MRPSAILLLPALLFGLTACDPGELPVPAHDPGDVITRQVEMGANYQQQMFYDLGTDQLVSSNAKEIWDLGFEASADGWKPKL